MNIQTEQLENHTARLTVEIDNDRLERAKKEAAKKVSRKVQIPGFRKGKAPYRVLVRSGLEPQILEEAVDKLSQDVYKESLEESELEPYGPGRFEDFQLEDGPTFVYTVPLQPTVNIGDYRSIRVDYDEPEVTEDELEESMRRIQQQQATTEESDGPVKEGDRITMDIHGEFADEPEDDVTVDSEGNEIDAPAKGDQYIHQHEAQIDLDRQVEPVLTGFIDSVVGANVGDELEFDLTVPEDEEVYKGIEGRQVHFHVTISQIESVQLPELDDDLAAEVTQEEEDGPLTLEALRERMRDNLYQQKKENTDQQYFRQVLEKIIEMSEFSFPDVMVDEQIDDLIQDFEGRLQQQGMDLDTYLNLTGQSRDDLREQYRDTAIETVRRSLALREVVQQEGISVTDEMLNERIDGILDQFGAEQKEQIRGMFDTPQMRSNLANEMLQNLVTERLTAIAKGEEVPAPGESVEAEASLAEGEAQAEVASADDDQAEEGDAGEEEEADTTDKDETATQ